MNLMHKIKVWLMYNDNIGLFWFKKIMVNGMINQGMFCLNNEFYIDGCFNFVHILN